MSLKLWKYFKEFQRILKLRNVLHYNLLYFSYIPLYLLSKAKNNLNSSLLNSSQISCNDGAGLSYFLLKKDPKKYINHPLSFAYINVSLT